MVMVGFCSWRRRPGLLLWSRVAPGLRPVSLPRILVRVEIASFCCSWPWWALYLGRSRGHGEACCIVPYSQVLSWGDPFFLGAGCAVARRNLIMILIGWRSC